MSCRELRTYRVASRERYYQTEVLLYSCYSAYPGQNKEPSGLEPLALSPATSDELHGLAVVSGFRGTCVDERSENRISG